MLKSFTIKTIAASAIFHWAGSASAHENHGLTGSHWHASDAWGFVALAAMVAVALWLGRGGK